MTVQDCVASLRKEHQELLHAAAKIESALALGCDIDSAGHVRCLRDLQALEAGLGRIEEHFQHYHYHSAVNERVAFESDRAEIACALAEFRKTLRFALPSRARPLQGPGMALVERLRSHVAREEHSVQEHRDSTLARGTRHKRICAAVAMHPTKTQRRRVSSHKASAMPYTMEAHPEL